MSKSMTIQTKGLTRRFGSATVVDGLDLAVPEGSVFGFLGPNGSGKTTTLRMLLGLIKPHRGVVELNGANLRRNRRQALTGVGAIIEQPALYPSLTGRDALKMTCILLGHDQSRIDPILDVVGLKDAAHKRSKNYSLGMRQRLALAQALIGDPTLLILDEPTNGLDPSGIAEMRALIKSLPARFGTTVLLSSHLLSEVEQVANHCALIKSGKLVFQGPIAQLKADAGATLVIGADKPGRVVQLLGDRGLKGYQEGQRVMAVCDWDEMQLAAFLRTLVEDGLNVTHYELRAAQLENLFLQLTGTGGTA
ncbi:ABC transporter ATP-binding protein [Parvularcula sp. LCG005]|uniref:ABC transporter ATP-binding protein n=1 Tax=Parvularcula sp. LCG005 TaxID=3078805 RepID=UPI00294373BC|nr:ABC transporter ATP-binding protein [Parvularcula sp. LCG005]WOI54727.1 ABC transporter ATP-binding protein [Parvularcula sp. LCG005]